MTAKVAQIITKNAWIGLKRVWKIIRLSISIIITTQVLPLVLCLKGRNQKSTNMNLELKVKPWIIKKEINICLLNNLNILSMEIKIYKENMAILQVTNIKIIKIIIFLHNLIKNTMMIIIILVNFNIIKKDFHKILIKSFWIHQKDL